MRRAFTLVELLVVIVVIVSLMMIVFRLGSIGSDAEYYNRTIVRIQRLENCLSGYYAAFGSYPPVKLHGVRDIYLRVGRHGIQTDERNENIWSWDPEKFDNWVSTGDGRYFQQQEADAWAQVRAACRSQPMACMFPYPQGYGDVVRAVSDEMKERATSGDEEYKSYWQDEDTRERLSAGFDDGGSDSGSVGRFSRNKGEVDWRRTQIFQFGVMSYLLPRYMVMMNGADEFFTSGFAQWDQNNTMPCDPFTGYEYNNWRQLKNYGETGRQQDIAHIANIPSQAACARWMPNLEGTCRCAHDYSLFGIKIKSATERGGLLVDDTSVQIFSPSDDASGSCKDQYVLDSVTLQDGWWQDIYYYSPEPHQTYTVWSSGKNKRTFPPWISRKTLSSRANECVSRWVSDDIIHLSN